MTRSYKLYLASVSAFAGLFFVQADWELTRPTDLHWNAVVALCVLCFASEATYLKLRVGRTETQSSVAFIPYIAAFLLFESGWAALVTSASMLGVEFFVRHKTFDRLLFNTAQIALSIGAASVVFQALGGQPGLSTAALRLTPVSVAAGIVTYFFLNGIAVSLAVSLALGEPLKQAWLRIAVASLVYDLVSAPLGAALAYLYARFELPGILLLVLPILFVRHIYQVNFQLEQVNRDLLELMVKAIEARDPYTSGHSQRVAELARAISHGAGMSARAVERIETAALLHDVGKIHEQYAPLLRKEGKLDPTERALMQTHSTRSAELVATISAFRGVIADAVRHHHENFDGTGYPAGLAGSAIPPGARVIMIADTIDAMTTDRPYRKALPVETVVAELQKHAGRQFDPELVRVTIQSPAVLSLIRSRVSGETRTVSESVR